MSHSSNPAAEHSFALPMGVERPRYYCTTLFNSFRTHSVPLKNLDNLMDYGMNIVSDDTSNTIKYSFQVIKHCE